MDPALIDVEAYPMGAPLATSYIDVRIAAEVYSANHRWQGVGADALPIHFAYRLVVLHHGHDRGLRGLCAHHYGRQDRGDLRLLRRHRRLGTAEGVS